ncbi:UNVERIFIED_CONTAM: hypothetical protein Slati_1114100 [Sesamum latifolium]|uniref:Reverse transcriptase Ty1/copia-type domain-containing protein n=1 Tax=Sesamum latifolium TaxID=2727402 RepID=A0AAW2XB63_9LAMI
MAWLKGGIRTLLDMVQSMMNFTELTPSFWGYALETAAKLFNMVPSKTVPQMLYEIWHDKPASYKYLRVWGSPVNVKRLVGDKLDSRSSLCSFVGYSKETAEYYFYDPSEQKIFVLRNSVFLEKVPTDGVRVLHRSTRESRPPERYGFVGLTSQMDNDPRTYGEAMSNIDSDKWLDAMKFEMDSMGLNQVWTLVDPPKGVKPVGCKWVYKRKLGADREVTTFKARLVAKGYTQRPRVDFEKTYLPVAMAKSIRRSLWINRRVSLSLEKNRKSVISKGPSMASNKLSKAGTHVLMKLYGVMISSRMSMILVYTRRSVGARLHTLCFMSMTSCSLCTRPDIAYALNVTSRYQACAGETHWSAVKTILKYLKKTKDMFFIYDGGELILEGYSDTSFQLDDDDAKSQSGFVFKLNGGVVAWKRSKQATTTDSTMEAEYIATSEAAKEAIWMKNYIQELGVAPSIAEPVVIFYNNIRAIAQAKESRSHPFQIYS